jgi:L-seryl-tRNA(Ser) seleniumtransferase
MTAIPSIYKRLGIKPLINAQGTYTTLGGSLMPAEVVQAMVEAAGAFVSIPEFQEKAGARIAGLLGVPAALVTAGAASAITIATAACMAHGHPRALDRLPDISGLKNEVILQKAHHSGYEPQIAIAGAKLVWVETMDELERAISERTAMLFFVNRHDPEGQVKRDAWVRLGKKHSVPLLNDAAADVPPPARFSEYVNEGFDLVAFSGGKAIRGPQSTGLLVGRADLIAVGRQAISPHMGLGRGMKVGKEEIAGLLAAIERFMTLDHAAEWQRWETQCATLIETLSKIPGMTTRRDVPEIANRAPHVVLTWSRFHSDRSSAEVVRALRAGDPPIAVLAEGDRGLRLAVWTLRDDEPKIVADQIAQLFGGPK